MEQPELISCDWGLSTLRVRVLAGSAAPEILLEYSAARGIAGLAGQQPAEFGATLQDAILAVFGVAGQTPPPLPVFLSGMVCSSLGWRELPYATLPFPLDGSQAVICRETLSCPWGRHPLTFVSGIASRDDAMRGEECEVIGLSSGRGPRPAAEKEVVVLPGTHSKAVEIAEGSVRSFRTYLTGELFDVLCRDSVLRHSVGPESPVEADEAYEAGVRRSAGEGLLGSLFSVRAQSLLQGIGQRASRRYLSGLLIGDEVSTVLNSYPVPVSFTLGGSAQLQKLYLRAFELLGAGSRVRALPGDVTARAASLGHWRLFASAGRHGNA